MARKKQETLVLFPEVLTVTRKFSDEQFGVLMRAAFSYRLNGEVYSGDDMAVDVAFQIIANQINRHQEYCDTLANNAKGSKGEQREAKVTKTQQNHLPIHSVSYPYPYPIHSDPSKSNTDTPQKPARFSPPSVDEVREYCDQKGYSAIDPERFVSYYAARQWMAGQTAITDWQAAVDSWNGNDVDKKRKSGGRESGVDRLARMYKEEFGK